jgi:S1-C subfamily serine protease
MPRGLPLAMRRAAWVLVYLALAAGGVAIGFQLSARFRTVPPPQQASRPAPKTEPAIAPDPPAPAPPPVIGAAPGFALPGPSFAQLVKDVGPSVVHIQVRVGGGPSAFGVDEMREGQGTGFIISPDGYILTNDHVVGNAEKITVRLLDDREFEGKVIGSDPNTDIALIKIDDSSALPAASLGDSDAVDIGEWVVAIGNPFGLDHTVTAGIVSAKGRRNVFPGGRSGTYDFIQTDASINPGNSGGPLINMRGEVIGINSAISAQGQGIGFAIPINMAKMLMPQLKQTGRVARSYIGVVPDVVPRDIASALGLASTDGALIRQIVANSPAQDADLRAGDVIVEFDGKPVRTPADLRLMAGLAGVGKTVTLGVIGDSGKRRQVEITLQEIPSR